MLLPTEPVAAISQNPKFLIIFGKPKSGKTTAVSMLPNNLLIDLENGSYFLSCLKIQARTVQDLGEIAAAINKKTKEEGKAPYQYVTIDNGTVLEDIALSLAAKIYKDSPMGKN
jgi:tRNA 2-selenouridine synthase SelU